MENSQNAVVELHFFPNLAYMAHFFRFETVKIEQFEHFRKGTLRNRCEIATAQGIQTLSVPLVRGGLTHTYTREVKIANQNDWQRQHWKSIATAYGNAPFWEHYAPQIAPFFEKKYTFLWDLNLEILDFYLKNLKIDPKNRQFTTEWNTDTGGEQDLRNWAEKNPNEAENSLKYPQIFEEKTGFLNNLSMLDALFCMGAPSLRKAFLSQKNEPKF